MISYNGDISADLSMVFSGLILITSVLTHVELEFFINFSKI